MIRSRLQIVLCMGSALTTLGMIDHRPGPQRQAKVDALPIAFVANAGQTDSRVLYSAEGPGYGIYFTRKGVVCTFTRQTAPRNSKPASNRLFLDRPGREKKEGIALSLLFEGGLDDVTPSGQDPAPGRFSYFRGNDRGEWRTGLSAFRTVTYPSIWSGVDGVFRGVKGRLKYEFIVRPGTDVKSIRLSYAGAKGLSLDDRGGLRIETPLGTFTDEPPFSYQEIGGRQVAVESRYVLLPDRDGRPHFGFELGDGYDPNRPVVIDPGLIYSTFLGGSLRDTALGGVAVDAAGNMYVCGYAESPGFPTTLGAFDATHNGSRDVFLAKLDPTSSTLIYSTFIGGTELDQPWGMTIDSAGAAYITGLTGSSDYPTTPGAFDTTYNDVGFLDGFVTKVDPTGSILEYSTFLGGSTIDSGRDVVVDGAGFAYVTGFTCSPGFPVTPGAFDTTHDFGTDGFVAKLDPAGANLIYCTFLGGSGFIDPGLDIAIDSAGNAVVTGWTDSPDFPTTPGAYQTTIVGEQDAYVTMLDATGSSLIYSTLIGGSGTDIGNRIDIDPAGNVYVAGGTRSTDFPTTPGALDTTYNGDPRDIFVSKLDPTGSLLVYSTFVGGVGRDEPLGGVVVGADGSVYVSGFTQSADYPTTPTAFDDTYGGGGTFTGDAFVFRLDEAGDTLLYSTYLGGSEGEIAYGLAVDGEGNVYLAGSVESVDFPTTAGAFDTIQNGDVDAYASKLSLPGSTPPGLGKKVSPTDSTTGKNPVELTFSDITSGGITSVTTSPAGAPPPTGFRLGTPPTYYEITTTATFSGVIEICIDYTDVDYGNECTMKVAHFEDTDSDGILDTWVDLPISSQDKINDIICAVASSLSPFALFEAEDTDGDGVPDLLDPDPLVAGETLATLAGAANLLANQVRAVDLSLFDAPNANAAAGRRKSLASRLENAGKAAAAGDLEDALELLEGVLGKVDGLDIQVDWTESSPETSGLASQVRLLIGTITGL